MYRRFRLISQQAGRPSNRQTIMNIYMYRPIGAMLYHAIGFHKTGACCKSQQLQNAMQNQTGVGMQGVLGSKPQVFGCLLAQCLLSQTDCRIMECVVRIKSAPMSSDRKPHTLS